MQSYEIAETETQPSVGGVVNMADMFSGETPPPIRPFRIVGEGVVSHYSEADGCCMVQYPAMLMPHNSYGNYPRMEDGGCALCSGCGCQDCGFTGGY